MKVVLPALNRQLERTVHAQPSPPWAVVAALPYGISAIVDSRGWGLAARSVLQLSALAGLVEGITSKVAEGCHVWHQLAHLMACALASNEVYKKWLLTESGVYT